MATVAIKSSFEFSRVFNKGRRFPGKYATLFFLAAPPLVRKSQRMAWKAAWKEAQGAAREAAQKDMHGAARGVVRKEAQGAARGATQKAAPAEISGFGVTASRKVGRSVRRNRLKRLVRESYRSLEPCVRTGCQFVFVLRPAQQAAAKTRRGSQRATASLLGLPGYAEIMKDVTGMLARAGAYTPPARAGARLADG